MLWAEIQFKFWAKYCSVLPDFCCLISVVGIPLFNFLLPDFCCLIYFA
jgi:hypothetical protein